MKTWIVTGGAASGKSTFARLLKDLVRSGELFCSDQVVHALLARPEIIRALSEKWGQGVVIADGTVNRQAVRELVFADEAARKWLESLLHPGVYEELSYLHVKLAAERNTQLLIAEVPLFYESGSDFPADLVIVIATGAELQQERLTGQRGLDADTAERIRAAQWPLSRKQESADKVVWNEGSMALLELQAQILVQQLNC